MDALHDMQLVAMDMPVVVQPGFIANPVRAARFPLHQTRFGLFWSTSILRGSDSESGSGNSTHSPVLGLNRAILSACCSLTQIRLFFLSTLTEYVPGVSVGGAKNVIWFVSKSTFISLPAFQRPTQMSPRASWLMRRG